MKILAVLLQLVNWLVNWSPGPRRVESTTRPMSRQVNRLPPRKTAPTRSILWTFNAGSERQFRILEVPA